MTGTVNRDRNSCQEGTGRAPLSTPGSCSCPLPLSTEARHIFYISDSTGLTVEELGRSVLAQFSGTNFIEQTLGFVDSPEKAEAVAQTIRKVMDEGQPRPIIFCTFANKELETPIAAAGALTLDCLNVFIQPVAKELQREPSHESSGRFSSDRRGKDYQRRIDAVNYTLGHDDGISLRDFSLADIILIGVSRSGKTPTSLYMALHYGIFAANYPLVDEDLTTSDLPRPLRDYQRKLYGLSIDAHRLAQIRNQRRPDSRYANIEKCQQEINAAMRIFKLNNIPFLNVTQRSIEELAAKIIQEAKLHRYL